MARKIQKKVFVEQTNVFTEESDQCGDVIYVLDNQQMVNHQVEYEEQFEGQPQVYQILEEVVDEQDEVYEVIETNGGTADNYIVQDEIHNDTCDEYETTSDNIESIEIISDVNEGVENEEIIYVTTEDVGASESEEVTFMQVCFITDIEKYF